MLRTNERDEPLGFVRCALGDVLGRGLECKGYFELRLRSVTDVVEVAQRRESGRESGRKSAM